MPSPLQRAWPYQVDSERIGSEADRLGCLGKGADGRGSILQVIDLGVSVTGLVLILQGGICCQHVFLGGDIIIQYGFGCDADPLPVRGHGTELWGFSNAAFIETGEIHASHSWDILIWRAAWIIINNNKMQKEIVMKIEIVSPPFPPDTPQIILENQSRLMNGAKFVPAILRKVARKYRNLLLQNVLKRKYFYTLLILFVFNFCVPMIDTLTGSHIAFKLPLTTYPLFYLLLGHYFYNEKPKWAEEAWIPVAGTAVSVTVVLTVGIAGLPLGYVMDYHRPVCALFAASMFLLFHKIRKPASGRIWALDRLCFGVYLIHPLFIQFVYKFLHITPIGTPLYPVLAVVFALGFATLSFAASWVMAQIKPLKKYVL